MPLLRLLVNARRQFLQLTFQLLNLLAHARQTPPQSVQSFVLFERLDGRAPPDAGPNDLARQDSRLRAYDRSRHHARVVAEADLTADDRVRLDDCAARNAGLRSDDDALAYPHVVADLHEVVNLRPATDPRLAQSAAVNATARADLNVVFDNHGSDLRELVVDARLVAHVAEPVRADDHARVQHHTLAESHAVVQNHVRMKHAPAPHADALADDRARENLRALAYLCALAYTDTRADVNAVAYLRARRNARRRMDERVAASRRAKRLCDEREGE